MMRDREIMNVVSEGQVDERPNDQIWHLERFVTVI